jgi:2-keto-4-pentenoate hydratase
MSTLERRLDRLEQGRDFICELWCCATESDAKALITRLRSDGLSPWFVFIPGKPNSGGSPCWHIKGRTVADLWRAIDAISPGLELQGIESTPRNPRFDAVTDEQLLSVIAGARCGKSGKR